jgi:hypothetical protein
MTPRDAMEVMFAVETNYQESNHGYILMQSYLYSRVYYNVNELVFFLLNTRTYASS